MGHQLKLSCVKLKSVAGQYRDVISMSPNYNINANKFNEVWSNLIKVASEIVVTMTDGYSA